MLERSRRALAGGLSSLCPRQSTFARLLEDGYGMRLRDVDGNEYIDLHRL
jgi:glutamate-1-semialdehyde aminotransferase